MQIVVASGKGGTGKTLVSTSLARMLADIQPTQYLDCDVEEPNGRLFLCPDLGAIEPITVRVPSIAPDRCTHCGACSQFCAFNAIAVTARTATAFPELCHSCGGCALVCPAEAITWVEKTVGSVQAGVAGDLAFLEGCLRVGEPASPPLIRAVKARVDTRRTVIVDAPPGTSCPAMNAMHGSDLVLLVAEPTPFGVHDLSLALDVARELRIPSAVVVNRDGIGDEAVSRLCNEAGIAIWARIPHDLRIASCLARGESALERVPDLRIWLQPLVDRIAAMGAM